MSGLLSNASAERPGQKWKNRWYSDIFIIRQALRQFMWAIYFSILVSNLNFVHIPIIQVVNIYITVTAGSVWKALADVLDRE